MKNHSKKNSINEDLAKNLSLELEKSTKKEMETLEREFLNIKNELKTEIHNDISLLSQKIEDIHFNDVIAFLDEHKDEKVNHKINKILTERLKKIENSSNEDLAITYYYLIKNILHHNTIIEEQALIDNYDNFKKYIIIHEKQLIANMKIEKKNKKLTFYPQAMRLKIFLKMAQTFFLNLENEFKTKNFIDLSSSAYKRKMRYHQELLFFRKKYLAFLGYKIWSLTSDYGENVLKWGITSISFVILFAVLLWTAGEMQFVAVYNNQIITNPQLSSANYYYSNHPMLIANNGHWYDYFYFATVTFTTLGYGDIIPITFIDKTITMIGVLIGYVMLGLFLTLLAKKV